jgi:hypothetical protein
MNKAKHNVDYGYNDNQEKFKIDLVLKGHEKILSDRFERKEQISQIFRKFEMHKKVFLNFNINIRKILLIMNI